MLLYRKKMFNNLKIFIYIYLLQRIEFCRIPNYKIKFLIINLKN